MKKKAAIMLLALLLLAALARFAQVTLGAMGEGKSAASPDKKFVANAQSVYTAKFWGGRHNYYELTMTSAAGRRIHHLVMDEPPQGMSSVREDDCVRWADDSASVTYTFKGARLTLSVNP